MSVAAVSYKLRREIPLIDGAVCPAPLRLDHAGARLIPSEGGYVYVIGIWGLADNRVGDLCKIGISNQPRNRLLQIWSGIFQSEDGPLCRPFIYLSVAVRNHAEIEGLAHHKLREKREWGEWFACSIDEAAGVVLQLEKDEGRPIRAERELFARPDVRLAR